MEPGGRDWSDSTLEKEKEPDQGIFGILLLYFDFIFGPQVLNKSVM